MTAHLGREARELDPARRRVVDDQGTEYTYETLLLATGGTPRRLPFGGDGVLYYRTVADYRRLRALTERGGNASSSSAGDSSGRRSPPPWP